MTSIYGLTAPFNRDIGSWDVSGITVGCAVFGGPLLFGGDVTSWGVSGDTNAPVSEGRAFPPYYHMDSPVRGGIT
jgi:hypothetical protein